jgi:hypothetical protein
VEGLGLIVTEGRRRKVIFCTPTLTHPHPAFLAALEAAVPALDAAGIDHQTAFRAGCPYISHARADLLRTALDAQPDAIVFIDHDVSFRPADLVKLVETEGDVVAGTYRYKKDDEEYMGALMERPDGLPSLRADGCIRAHSVPAGFLKITSAAVCRFMAAYPELAFGPAYRPSIDLFNHGAHERVWYGEDMAFSRRWRDCGGEIWIVPDLELTHHSADRAYPGNYHLFLMRQPGGALDPARRAAA